jgi:hypothetical protein
MQVKNPIRELRLPKRLTKYSLTEIDRRQEALGKLDQDLVSIDLTDGNLENQIRFNALVEVKEATFAKQLAMLRMAKDSAISLQEAGCTADAYIAYTRILEGYHKLDMPTGYDVRNILINMAKILWANKDDYRAQSLAWQDLESRDQTLRAHPSDLRLLKDIARSLLRTTPEIQQIIQSQMPGQPPYPCNSLLPALHAMIESKSNYASQVSGNVLQPGPYPDLNGDPPPESPIVGGIQAVLEFLGEFSDTQLEARDSRGRTPLFLAAFHCKEGLGLALLIRAKNDPRMLYRVVTARDRSGQTVLSVAISSRCSLLFVTALIDHGAEVDPHMVAQAMTPLQAACSVGSLEIVDLLMTKGATTNAAYPDNSPPPPLAIAQEQGHIDIVDRLSYSSPGSTRSYTARENDCGG